MDKPDIKISSLVNLFLEFFNKVDNYAKKIQKENLENKYYIKQKNEKFTDFDWLIQKSVEDLIEEFYPQIKIVGEEDTSVKIEITKEKEDFLNDIKASKPPKNILESELKEIININDIIPSNKRIVLFIDPIDATNQLIKKNYNPATVLIGICVDNIPFLGFIHYPFERYKDQPPFTIFNYPSKGIYLFVNGKVSKQNIGYKPDNKWDFIISKSRTKPEMLKFIENFPNSSYVKDSGLGNKAVQAVLDDFVYFTTGKMSIACWDICSADCLAREIGGGFYDFEGNLMVYFEEKKYIDKMLLLINNKNRLKPFIEIVNKTNNMKELIN